MTAVQTVNDSSPDRALTLLILPDKPRERSKRGLADEEDYIQKELTP